MINKESLIYDVLQKTNLEEELVKKFAESNQKFFEGINESIENISSYEAIHYFSVKLDNIKGESGNLNVYTPTLAGRIRNDPMMKRTETIPYRRVKGGYQ